MINFRLPSENSTLKYWLFTHRICLQIKQEYASHQSIYVKKIREHETKL
jgi:hypothetical protein